MKIGIIGEGETEYYSVPTLVAKLGHTVVGVNHLGGVGSDYPWHELFCNKVFPYVRGFAVKAMQNRPDKVIVILDRERREQCCGQLASAAKLAIAAKLDEENIDIPVSIVLPNPIFECWLFANSTVLDGSKIMKRSVSEHFNDSTDEKDVLAIVCKSLKRGCAWDKPKYGKALAQKLDLTSQRVLNRSRSLRKFVKELS